MIRFLLLALFFIQGQPIAPAESGSITGILRNASGAPAAGVRIAAMARPESATEIPTALVSLGETDATGQYRLDGIPPGRYYVTAGRVDLPTYFPGTLERTAGTVVTVAAGDRISGLDFSLQDFSVRPAASMPAAFRPNRSPDFLIPLKITVDGVAKVPLFGSQGILALRFTNILDDRSAATMPLNNSVVTNPLPGPGAYRVTVENIPDGFSVMSVMYGATDLARSPLNVSTANAGVSFTNVVSNMALSASELEQYVAILAAQTATPTGPVLSIVLTASPRPTVPAGARITGRLKVGDIRPVYLSGTAGIVYSDGTFEFRGVAPGRYILSTLNNPRSTERPLGASLVVGSKDLEGIELPEVALLPLYLRSAVPGEAASQPAGIVPLASLQGSVVDESTKQPFSAGTVSLIGDSVAKFQLGPDGRFRMDQLLPGTYSLEVNIYAVGIINRTIVIEDKDVSVEISAR